MRQVVLDTETTGLSWERGHRVVEIGCIELIKRRPTGNRFQRYLNPDRAMDAGAMEVTGINNDFLLDKPRFHEVVDEFLEFIRGAELIIHNAAFDVGFLDNELALLGGSHGCLRDHASVLDSLALARERYPGQRNSLDALCKRLGVDNSHRSLHGALLDAELLAEVYLALTSGQGDLALAVEVAVSTTNEQSPGVVVGRVGKVIAPGAEDLDAHAAALTRIDRKSGGRCLWPRNE